MKIVSSVVAAAVLCTVPTSCGTAVAGRPVPALAPATTQAPVPAISTFARAPQQPRTGDEAEVEAVFRDYYGALLLRDFARACELNTPETQEHLVANLEAQGTPTASCEEALAVIYGSPAMAAAADRITNDAEIENIAVDGDQATIAWSYPVDGRRQQATNELQRVEGAWLLVDITD